MARLPSALKRKEQDWSQAQQLRQENLARLDRAARGREPGNGGRQAEAARLAAPAEAPAVLPAKAPAVAAASVEAEPAELERLRSRLATTEGMHRADNERHRQALAEAQVREAELKRRLQAVERQPAAAPTREELRRYVTPQQLAEFGEEQCRLLVAAARTAAGEVSRGAVQAEMDSLRQELAEQRGAMQAGFWSAVNTAMPRWREVNADPQFLAWLGERDALAGRPRQALLDEARAALDAERVAAIFNAWLQGSSQGPSARDASRRVIPNGKPGAAVRTDQAAPTTVSRGWIAEQNRLYSQGYYRRRPGEWAAVQETIDKAAREGRIR